jgi:hypothetical protein
VGRTGDSYDDHKLFTFFLGMESARLHRWAVGALAVGLTLTMFTIIALDHPFGGSFRVGPERFESALDTIEGNNKQGT